MTLPDLKAKVERLTRKLEEVESQPGSYAVLFKLTSTNYYLTGMALGELTCGCREEAYKVPPGIATIAVRELLERRNIKFEYVMEPV